MLNFSRVVGVLVGVEASGLLLDVLADKLPCFDDKIRLGVEALGLIVNVSVSFSQRHLALSLPCPVEKRWVFDG